jgi:hypothetical protein
VQARPVQGLASEQSETAAPPKQFAPLSIQELPKKFWHHWQVLLELKAVAVQVPQSVMLAEAQGEGRGQVEELVPPLPVHCAVVEQPLLPPKLHQVQPVVLTQVPQGVLKAHWAA